MRFLVKVIFWRSFEEQKIGNGSTLAIKQEIAAYFVQKETMLVFQELFKWGNFVLGYQVVLD